MHQLQLVALSPLWTIAFLVIWQSRSTYLTFRFHWFSLCGQPDTQTLVYDTYLFSLGLLFRPGLRDDIWKSQIVFCVLFSLTNSGFYQYYFEVWSTINFLHNSLFSLFCWIHLSFRMHQHLTNTCASVASYLYLDRIALFCIVIRRDSVSLGRFSIRYQVQIPSVYFLKYPCCYSFSPFLFPCCGSIDLYFANAYLLIAVISHSLQILSSLWVLLFKRPRYPFPWLILPVNVISWI